MAEKKKKFFLRMLLLFLLLGTTVPSVSANIFVTHGLFGEVVSHVVTDEKKDETASIVSAAKKQIAKQKGRNVFNIWLFLLAFVLCIIFLMCVHKLPREDTIVDDCVRMND